MVELRLLAGADPGVRTVEKFPFSLGRQGTDWILAVPGVWERHLTIDKSGDRRFQVHPHPSAPVAVGGTVLEAPRDLANGDVLEFGMVRLQFRIAATRQRSLRSLENVTWLGIGLLAAVQIGLASCW